jgi:hypothetical protein
MKGPLLVSCISFCFYSLVTSITLDGSKTSHVYDGHGGLSAGASSRLLIDYPDEQRSDVLDMLFLPNHGMGLHMLKVEVGGDAQRFVNSHPYFSLAFASVFFASVSFFASACIRVRLNSHPLHRTSI